MFEGFHPDCCDHCCACALVEVRAWARLMGMESIAVSILIASTNTITNVVANSLVLLSL